MRCMSLRIFACIVFATAACTSHQQRGAPGAGAVDYDIVITNGKIYDGNGGAPIDGDIAIKGDRIAAIGDLGDAQSTTVIDARGHAVTPGFINMLSWAPVTLLEDGRGLSDIKQGVTLEVFGEGQSMGPWNDPMKAEAIARQGDIKYEIEWTSLAEFLGYLETRGRFTEYRLICRRHISPYPRVGRRRSPPRRRQNLPGCKRWLLMQ